MKLSKSTIWAFIILLVSASLYRLIPNRPAGFAPQLAMAIFGGAIFKDKRWAFLLPILSLFLSDLLFAGLNAAGLTETKGFYSGQWAMYLLFIALTWFGTLMQKRTVLNVAVFSIAGSVIFFVASNFITWKTGYGFGRPQTWAGFVACNADAIAYYRSAGLIPGFAANFILGDLIWNAILFGGYALLEKFSFKSKVATVKH